MRFWDASALVPLLVSEPASDPVLALLNGDSELLVWWGSPVECVSALARREREGAMTPAAVTAATDRLRMLAAAWQEVLPGDGIRAAAQRLLRVHPLRAADALQLAAAVIASEHDPASLPFVCLDER
ncbi:MAG TPA: type II toxin-antitoxin system VapC family toxin, partial [Anaeromyxobacteraceae bacterium]|nr:type II toxin-antitoxin system VapC family toxin [Anaeromyxobacteraceae bacterium]